MHEFRIRKDWESGGIGRLSSKLAAERFKNVSPLEIGVLKSPQTTNLLLEQLDRKDFCLSDSPYEDSSLSNGLSAPSLVTSVISPFRTVSTRFCWKLASPFNQVPKC